MSDLLSPLGDIKLTYTGHANRISSFGVQNFAGLKDKAPVEIKPFTILTGKSGSGKTSFLSALTLLKRFIKKSKDNSLYLGKTKFYSFNKIVHNDNEKEVITMDMVLDKSPLLVPGRETQFRHLLYNLPEKLELKLMFHHLPEEERHKVLRIRIKGWEIRDPASGFHLKSELNDEINYDGAQYLNVNFGRFNKRIPDEIATSFEKNFNKFFINASDEEINKIQQIYSVYFSYPTFGSFLLKCRRKKAMLCHDINDSEKKLITQQVNKILGEGDYSEEIWDRQNNNFMKYNSAKYMNLIIIPFYQYVTACLKETAKSVHVISPEMIYTSKTFPTGCSVNRLECLNMKIENNFYHHPKGRILNEIMNRFGYEELDDIKYVSATCKQIYNIMGRLVLSNEYDLLLIENPELNLDNKMQSELVKVLAEKREGRRYIIETKSEFLINEIKTLAEKGVISSEDVGVYEF